MCWQSQLTGLPPRPRKVLYNWPIPQKTAWPYLRMYIDGGRQRKQKSCPYTYMVPFLHLIPSFLHVMFKKGQGAPVPHRFIIFLMLLLYPLLPVYPLTLFPVSLRKSLPPGILSGSRLSMPARMRSALSGSMSQAAG